MNTARPFRRGTATALFDGIDVEVPPSWRVLLDGPAIFGGHDGHVPEPSAPDAPTLRIQATASFGGVDVKVGSVARVSA